MPPPDIRMIARRKFFKKLHVADERRAGIASFQQIVAQNPVLRKFSADRIFKGIHIVDAFADERAFAKNILIDIGHCSRVGINS